MPTETCVIQQAYRFALDATPRQQRSFASHVGGARYAYNWGSAQIIAALDAREAQKTSGETPATKIPSHFDLCKLWTAHKDNPDNALDWVGQNFVGTYQAALRDAAGAWKTFFASKAGKRGGRRVGRPHFKSKHRSRRSFQVHGATLQVVDAHHVKLPKIGVVKTHESTRKLLRRIVKHTARIVRGTISCDSSGRWGIALTVEIHREIRTAPSARQRAGGVVGLDLGVRDTITTSDGSRWENPGHLGRSQKKLAALNRALARCQKGSRRREKARAALGRAHHRIASLRLDATNKITSHLIHAYAGIAVEGWDVARLAEHGSTDTPSRVRHRRNRALADSAVGMVRWQLGHKAPWYGSTVIVTGKHETTGRTCSACGWVRTKPIPPAQEQFRCTNCGEVIDRRINSARVVAALALTGAPSSEEP